jgi:hypothetical protein
MDDFAVEIHNLPIDKFFKFNEHALRAYIWDWAEIVLNDQYQINVGSTEKFIKRADMPHLTLVDINFSRSDIKDIDCLQKIGQLKKEIRTLNLKVQRLSDKPSK